MALKPQALKPQAGCLALSQENGANAGDSAYEKLLDGLQVGWAVAAAAGAAAEEGQLCSFNYVHWEGMQGILGGLPINTHACSMHR